MLEDLRDSDDGKITRMFRCPGKEVNTTVNFICCSMGMGA